MTIAIQTRSAQRNPPDRLNWNVGYLIFVMGILLAAVSFAIGLTVPPLPHCEMTSMGDVAACFD